MVVDRQGWSDVAGVLAETLDRVLEIQAEASERIANDGEAGMLSKVMLLHFKSPDPEAVEVETAAEETAPE
jgi:hypothetical protein